MPRYRVIRFARVAMEQEVEADNYEDAMDLAYERSGGWTIITDDVSDTEVEEVRGL